VCPCGIVLPIIITMDQYRVSVWCRPAHNHNHGSIPCVRVVRPAHNHNHGSITCVCVVSSRPGWRGARPDLTSRKGRAEFENRVCVSAIDPVLQVRLLLLCAYGHQRTHSWPALHGNGHSQYRISLCNNRHVAGWRHVAQGGERVGWSPEGCQFDPRLLPAVEVSLSKAPHPDCS
jgi:hypothetical protein